MSSTKKKLGSSTRNPNILANDGTPMSFSLGSRLADLAMKIKETGHSVRMLNVWHPEKTMQCALCPSWIFSRDFSLGPKCKSLANRTMGAPRTKRFGRFWVARINATDREIFHLFDPNNSDGPVVVNMQHYTRQYIQTEKRKVGLK